MAHPPLLNPENDPRQRQYRDIVRIKNQRVGDRFVIATVDDDSLSGDGITAGTFVVIRTNFKTLELSPNQLVLIGTPRGLLVRHLYRTLDNKVRLVSSNAAFPDIVYTIEMVEVQGIVILREKDM